MNLGPTELIIILAIVLLLFGSRKLPDLARSLGKSSREFKKGLQESEQDASEEAPRDVPSEVPKDTSVTKKPDEGAAGGPATGP
jgi:sec-independent protein translocase protein TatA